MDDNDGNIAYDTGNDDGQDILSGGATTSGWLRLRLTRIGGSVSLLFS